MRFRTRQVHQRICDYIEAGMKDLGWGDASLPLADPLNAAVPFQATPLTYVEVQPDENGLDVAENTLSITLGDGGADDDAQMGGGLWQIPYPLFIDVYGASSGLALSIIEDVKGLINYGLKINALDYTTDAAGVATDEWIEFEDVTGPERPAAAAFAADFRKHWRIVKATVVVTHGE